MALPEVFKDKVFLYMGNECFDYSDPSKRAHESEYRFKEAFGWTSDDLVYKGQLGEGSFSVIGMGWKTVAQVFDRTFVAKSRASVAVVALLYPSDMGEILLPCMVKITLGIQGADPNNAVLPKHWSLAFDKVLKAKAKELRDKPNAPLAYSIVDTPTHKMKLFAACPEYSDRDKVGAALEAYEAALKAAVDDPSVQIVVMMPMGNDNVSDISMKDASTGPAEALRSIVKASIKKKK